MACDMDRAMYFPKADCRYDSKSAYRRADIGEELEWMDLVVEIFLSGIDLEMIFYNRTASTPVLPTAVRSSLNPY
jgi:hypothetical protein